MSVSFVWFSDDPIKRALVYRRASYHSFFHQLIKRPLRHFLVGSGARIPESPEHSGGDLSRALRYTQDKLRVGNQGPSGYTVPHRSRCSVNSNPKMGVLNRQARLPRVAYRFSTSRNPASIIFNYPTWRESTWQVNSRYRTRNPLTSLLLSVLHLLVGSLEEFKPNLWMNISSE